MSQKKWKNLSNRSYYGTLVAIMLAGLVLVNVIVSFLDFRVDFTADKRYSLTTSSIDFLSEKDNIPNRILFKIYLEGELPAELRRLRTAVRDKLEEFKYYAGKQIEYIFIDPNAGSPEDQQALKDQLFDKGRGIRPADIRYRSKGTSNILEVFPGAVVEYAGVTVDHIRFLEGGEFGLDQRLEEMIQKSINDLEFKFMQSISKATRREKKTIAFLHGHDELAIPFTQGARKNIEDAYTIKDVEIDGYVHALDEIDGLIIADPKEKFSDKDKFVIDQFLMRGGKLMLFYNPLEINNDTIRRRGMVHSVRRRTDIEKLMFDYGIKMNEDLVVDANYDLFAFPAIPRGFVSWYFYIMAQGTNHPVSSMVDPVKLPYASSLQFVETKHNTVPSVILTSSANSKSYGNVPLLSIAVEQTFGENPVFQDHPEDAANKLMVGGIIEGEFESAFKNRIIATYADDPEAKFQEKSTAPGKLMVVSNGTFFKNAYYDSVFVREQGAYRYIPRYPRGKEIDELLATNYRLGNFDFFENCVDYMMGESTLLSIRSRVIDLHPMDKLKVEKKGAMYKFINIFVPVLFVIVLAFIVFVTRRSKYAKRKG